MIVCDRCNKPAEKTVESVVAVLAAAGHEPSERLTLYGSGPNPRRDLCDLCYSRLQKIVTDFMTEKEPVMKGAK